MDLLNELGLQQSIGLQESTPLGTLFYTPLELSDSAGTHLYSMKDWVLVIPSLKTRRSTAAHLVGVGSMELRSRLHVARYHEPSSPQPSTQPMPEKTPTRPWPCFSQKIEKRWTSLVSRLEWCVNEGGSTNARTRVSVSG